MITFPCAKINLGLNIVEKRIDGYHNLETVFYPIPLTDVIEITEMHDEFPSDYKCNLNVMNIKIEGDAQSNLVVKAYNKLAQQYDLPRIHAHLYKRIPTQAGLGGGSSDCAFMIKALNELAKLGMSDKEMIEIAATLGADCPFFIYNKPCYAEGIGDKLTPISLDLSGLRLIMIKPECGVSTKEAYGGIIPKGTCEHFAHIRKPLEHLELLEYLPLLTNDFEETVCKIHPQIETIKKRLQDAGAIYAAMSGSGSTVFGLFKHDAEGRSDAQLRLLNEEFASMVIFNDTLR
jgi:4-diphosphocytidyl-2-C-methyl-D-erythritol kinase